MLPDSAVMKATDARNVREKAIVEWAVGANYEVVDIKGRRGRASEAKVDPFAPAPGSGVQGAPEVPRSEGNLSPVAAYKHQAGPKRGPRRGCAGQSRWHERKAEPG